MADELGTAVLKITVDDTQARDALRTLRRDVQRTSGSSGSGTSRAAEERRQRTERLDAERRERTARLDVERSARNARLDAERRERAARREALQQQREQQRQIDRTSRQGGAREGTRALELAQEKRFRLARRIDLLEERGVDTARVRARLGVLTEAQSRREFGTFRQRSLELARQVTLEERRLATQRRQERAQRREATIGASQGGARESVFALEKAQDRRFRVSQRIERLENRGADVSRLRTRLGDLTTAQANRQFGTFRQLGRELERQVKLTEARLQRENQIASAISRQARIGGARESILGRRGLSGSPADIKFLARQGGARSPIGGAVDIPGSPAFLAAQRRFSAQDLSRAAAIGGPRSPIGGAANIFGSPAFLARAASTGGPSSPIGGALNLPGSPAALKAEQRLAEARAKAAKAANDAAVAEGRRIGLQNAVPVTGSTATGLIPGSPAAINAAAAQRRRDLKEGRRIGSLNTSPVRGGSAFPGSPAFLDAQFPAFPADFFRTQQREQAKQQRLLQQGSKRRQDILSNAIIGGAFPALFGQGVGASLGGAAGGAAGGAIGGQFGFGLSLVGTALGAQFDLAAQKSKTLAEALNDPIGKFAELVEAGLLSSKALERNAKALIESGRAAEAAALIQLDLNKTFAGTATGGELTSVTDELGRAFTRLSVSMTQFSTGPLAGLLKLLGARFENDFQRNRSVQIESELRQAGLGSQADELRRQQFVPILESDTAEISRINDEFVNKIPRVQKANAQANADIAASQRSIEASQRLGFKITQASTQGYKIQTLELQKQEVLNARNRKLLELKPQERTGIRAQDIQADTAQKLFDLDTQINELRQERVALATEEAAKYQLAGEKLQQELKAVQALAALSQNAQRSAQFAVQQSTLQTIQGVGSSVGDAERREREIGAQISAARIRGGDAGEQEAARLVNEQKLAAAQTRLELEAGAKVLTEAGIKLREDVEAAFLSLQKLRTGDGGLNQYLSPQDRVNQEEKTFKALQPNFKEAQEQFKKLRGVNYAPEFSGSRASVNQAMIKFIEEVKTELGAVDSFTDTSAALNLNSTELGKLTTKIADLTNKTWAVNVQVAANGTSQVFGDAQNSALSVPQ